MGRAAVRRPRAAAVARRSLNGVAAYLLRAATITGWELLVVLGPALVVGAAMHAVADVTQRYASLLLGFRAYYYAGGWLGTVVHEGGHALFALLFGHEVASVKWFDARARDGTLGHVHHRYDRWNPIHRVGEFFIGIGPLVLGGIVVYAAARWLLGAAVFAPTASTIGVETWRAMRETTVALLTVPHLASWRFWAFVYVAFAVGSGARLSRSDLVGAARGLVAIAALLLALNAATLWSGDVGAAIARAAARLGATYAALMLLVVGTNAIAATFVLVAAIIVRGLWRRVAA